MESEKLASKGDKVLPKVARRVEGGRLIFKTPPPRFENLAKYHSRGTEMTFTIAPMKDLEIFAGGTHLETSPDDLPYAPRWTFSGGLAYRFLERFLLNVNSQYVGARYVSNPRYPSSASTQVSNYYLINAKLTYRLTPQNAPVQSHIYIAGENLANKQYEYLKDYPAPGITVMAGANLSF